MMHFTVAGADESRAAFWRLLHSLLVRTSIEPGVDSYDCRAEDVARTVNVAWRFHLTMTIDPKSEGGT